MELEILVQDAYLEEFVFGKIWGKPAIVVRTYR